MSVLLEKCFCLKLRTGVLIIGYLFLIFAAVTFIMHINMIISFYSSHAGPDVMNVMSVFQMSILAYILMTVSLIYGATKGKRYFMLPFLSFHLLLSFHAVIYNLLSALFLVRTLESITISGLKLAVNSFIIYVVISHHQELKKLLLDEREDDEEAIVNNLS